MFKKTHKSIFFGCKYTKKINKLVFFFKKILFFQKKSVYLHPKNVKL